jgi:hypothetical protein
VKLTQFDGHFKKYTIKVKGVSNEKKSLFYKRDRVEVREKC